MNTSANSSPLVEPQKRMVVLFDGVPASSDNEERIMASAALQSSAQHSVAANKDSRWLTLEVCREFQRGKCSRSEQDCKFAHPPPHVEVNNGKVVACFDNLKGRCQRVSPPCKYLHPPQHLKDILQQNGRNNLILRSLALNMAGNVQFPGASNATPLLATANGTGVGNANTAAFLAATSLGGHTIATGTAPANGGQATFLHSLTPGTAPMQFAYAPTALAAMFAGQNASLAPAPAGPTFVALNPSYGATGIPFNFQSPHGPTPMFEPAGFHTAFFQNQAAGTPAATFIPSYLTVRPPQATAIRTDRLEVCKDFQQGICPYSGTTCQYAHPPAHCPVDRDGLVTVCVDYVKGKCTRDSCKYFHPPEHLVTQLKALSGHHQSNIFAGAGHYPAVFCSTMTPTASAVANQRFVTAMMLAGGGSSTAAPALQHSAAMQTNVLPTGSFLVAPAGAQTAPTTAFFPGAAHILAGAGQPIQARPTILAPNPTQQFISALTYLPSKRQAIDEIVASAAKKRSYEEASTLQQQQLQPNQIDGLLQSYQQPTSTSSNCVISSSTSVQTAVPQQHANVDSSESIRQAAVTAQEIKPGSPVYELTKHEYEVANQQLPSVEQYTQTSNSSSQAQYVGRTPTAAEYTTGID